MIRSQVPVRIPRLGAKVQWRGGVYEVLAVTRDCRRCRLKLIGRVRMVPVHEVGFGHLQEFYRVPVVGVVPVIEQAIERLREIHGGDGRARLEALARQNRIGLREASRWVLD